VPDRRWGGERGFAAPPDRVAIDLAFTVVSLAVMLLRAAVLTL
jgi:hypothetical protein